MVIIEEVFNTMATISEITQGASYRGDPALGSGLGVGVTLDTSPIQRLATFTYYRDRDLWEKKNADDKLAAQQIASLAAYDTSSPLKPYSEDLKKELSDIQTFVRENPDALVYSRNPDKFQELNERMNRFNNKRKGATANDALYNAAKAKIELIPNKQDRDAQLEILDLNVKGLFKNGLADAYEQQIQLSPELKPKDYVIPEIPLTDDYTITRNPNDIQITGLKFIDVSRLQPLADAVYFGLGQGLDETTAEFKALSEDEKKRARLEARVTDKTRANLDSIASSVNGLIQQSKAGNPDLKVMDIPDNVLAKNSSVGGVISLAKDFNATMDKINAAAGKQYPYINLDDGATPQELILLQTYGKNKEAFLSELKPQIVETNDAIELENIRGDNARGWAGLQWDKDKFKLQTQGTENVKNGATIFADRLYKELMDLSKGTGQISPDQARQLTVEQKKYLGLDTPTFDEQSQKTVTGLKPLEVKKDDLIVLDNGKITILSEAKLDKVSNKWVGKFDNNRSTTISNIATNRLNEQLKMAGAKELNSYIPLDEGNIEVQSTTTGGGTTVSGSTSKSGGNNKTFNVVNPQTGKVVMSGVSKDQADKAAAKGYTIQ